MIEDLKDLPDFDQIARVHDTYSVRNIGNNAKVMRDDQNRRIIFSPQFIHEFDNTGLNRYIQSRRRLIGNQKLRISAKHHTDHNALPHTARNLMWISFHPLLYIGYFDISQHIASQLIGLLFIHFVN